MKLTLHDLDRLPVYSETNRSGLRKRLGKVVDVIFDPKTGRAIGYLVQVPNFLFIFRVKDKILAFDRATVLADKIQVDGKAAWDKQAEKRLGVNWETAVIWRGMRVRTTKGRELGYVRDAVIDEHDGSLNALGLTSGIAADLAVGITDMPANLVKGWNGSAIIVEEEARAIESDGGAAVVAGRATAVAQDRAEKAAAATVQGAKVAAAYTKSAVKVAAQSDTAKKAGRFFKSLGQQIVDNMGVPDDDEKK